MPTTTSLVSRYQLDLQYFGPDNREGVWRAYQSTRCTLGGDLMEGWGSTPGSAIENAVEAINAATPYVDEPEGEELEELCLRLTVLGHPADKEAADAIRQLLIQRSKMRRRFDEMYECAQKYGGSLQRIGAMLGLRAGDDVMVESEAALQRLLASR